MSCATSESGGNTPPLFAGVARLKQGASGHLLHIEYGTDLSGNLRLNVVALIEHERPLQVFSWNALFLLLFGTGLGVPVVVEFLETGFVPRLPTACPLRPARRRPSNACGLVTSCTRWRSM